MDPLILLGLLLLSSKKRSDNNTAAPTAAPEKNAKIIDDSSLVKRATQKKAQEWIADFLALGVTPDEAASLARWAGIESSGNPLAVSKLGERGLMQLTPETAKAATNTADWEARIRPTTSRGEHARIALAQARWHWDRAKRYIANPPTDPVSKVWYAKRHHARPADFNGRVMHGAAIDMAREQEATYAGQPLALRRLHAANVIAFGVPVVPGVRGATNDS